jgi:hypothetical protein
MSSDYKTCRKTAVCNAIFIIDHLPVAFSWIDRMAGGGQGDKV